MSFFKNNQTALSEWTEYFFNQLGLQDFAITELTSMVDKPKYRITIYKDIDFYHKDLSSPISASQLIIDTLKKELVDPILASEAVKEVISDKTDEIKKLEEENKRLKELIEELKPFKVYFELEYQLKHGKNE